jgi:CDP-paratose 2-epimerase
LPTRWEIEPGHEYEQGISETMSIDHSKHSLFGASKAAADLSYLMICAVSGRSYRVFGYKGKQVRDNIHSFDLVEAFVEFVRASRSGEVYNIGGGRHSNCSMLDAIALCDEISGRKLAWPYEEANRIGDHIWWISDVRNFKNTIPPGNFAIVYEKLGKEFIAQSLSVLNNSMRHSIKGPLRAGVC